MLNKTKNNKNNSHSMYLVININLLKCYIYMVFFTNVQISKFALSLAEVWQACHLKFLEFLNLLVWF